MDEVVGHTEAAVERALQRMGTIDLQRIEPATVVSDWTLTEEVLRFLLSIVWELRPQHVLEFGSGLSTRVLAWTSAFH